ncbi:MAG: thiamine biosynthesis protein ThiS [Actinobacteria bacterium]|jgi:sulfur carrier protein|nr:thiamine biosynthesis protein ThiS [Actinomycetota bacterium]|tara:strand:+ start:6282 stop:6497 length:216 start_codon:yes stop_codon:yes gene_type:complete
MSKNTISIVVNGKKQTFKSISNISDLLKAMNIKNESVAVAVNGTIIKKTLHESYVIKENSKIEIVHAVGGG